MKIEKSLVQQIIKEEVIKAKKIIVLKEERQRIIKQLNELYEEEGMEENIIKRAFGFELKDIAAALKHINEPKFVGKKEIYDLLGSEKYKTKFPNNQNAQEKFLEFVKDHPQLNPNEMRLDNNGYVTFKGAEDVKYKQTGRELAGNPGYTHGGMAQHLGGWEQ